MHGDGILQDVWETTGSAPLLCVYVCGDAAVALTRCTDAPARAVAALAEQGERDASLFLIVSGTLRVHDGATVVARLRPGEAVGELSALDPDVRTLSVTAEEETTLLRMEHSTLMDLIEEHTEVANGIIRFLVRRCRSATASVVRVVAEAAARPRA
jgi:CRP-like cAMP-binding protein